MISAMCEERKLPWAARHEDCNFRNCDCYCHGFNEFQIKGFRREKRLKTRLEKNIG